MIKLSDLGCKNIAQWNKLSKDEQKKRIEKALIETDLSTVKFKPKAWD